MTTRRRSAPRPDAVRELRGRLLAAERTLRAIRAGEVDAVVGADGKHVITLAGVDLAYRLLFDSMSEGAVTLTGGGIIAYCNSRFAALVRMPGRRVLGVPLRAGRDVGAADTADAPYVAVVSESFAKRYWPDEDPLGKRFETAFAERTVVGVAGDVRVRGLERDSEPQVYLPYKQVPDGALIFYLPKDLVVRASAGSATLVPALRAIIAGADPQQPISNIRALADVVDAQTAPRRTQLYVLGTFAGLAFLLAGIGIYGLLSFGVSTRSREIGVRMALGATPRSIVGMVLGEGFVLAAVGAALGLAMAYGAGRSLDALLAGVTPTDGPTLAAALAVALLMTLAGSVVPAWRAARIDPAMVIRME